MLTIKDYRRRKAGAAEYGTVAARILMGFLISLVFNGHVFSEETHERKEAEKIAEKVRRKAEHSEKAEGSQDLVRTRSRSK
jgi:hypothetical protein